MKINWNNPLSVAVLALAMVLALSWLIIGVPTDEKPVEITYVTITRIERTEIFYLKNPNSVIIKDYNGARYLMGDGKHLRSGVSYIKKTKN